MRWPFHRRSNAASHPPRVLRTGKVGAAQIAQDNQFNALILQVVREGSSSGAQMERAAGVKR